MNLKIKRIERGFKQYEFANMLNITPQYLRLIEVGKVDPRISILLKASKLLNVSIEELLN